VHDPAQGCEPEISLRVSAGRGQTISAPTKKIGRAPSVARNAKCFLIQREEPRAIDQGPAHRDLPAAREQPFGDADM